VPKHKDAFRREQSFPSSIEVAPEHTDSPRTIDDVFQLLVHVRGMFDTKAEEEILSALQSGALQVDYHIRGGARKTQPKREPTLEEQRVFGALDEALHERKASQKEMREEMDRATAFLYEHAPPEGKTGHVHREAWKPGRVFSLTIGDDRLHVLPACALDYPWEAYSFTIANWWFVDQLWPSKPPVERLRPQIEQLPEQEAQPSEQTIEQPPEQPVGHPPIEISHLGEALAALAEKERDSRRQVRKKDIAFVIRYLRDHHGVDVNKLSENPDTLIRRRIKDDLEARRAAAPVKSS
jgi:hypothetical protein